MIWNATSWVQFLKELAFIVGTIVYFTIVWALAAYWVLGRGRKP